jgi:hypothetical protein
MGCGSKRDKPDGTPNFEHYHGRFNSISCTFDENRNMWREGDFLISLSYQDETVVEITKRTAEDLINTVLGSSTKFYLKELQKSIEGLLAHKYGEKTLDESSDTL